MEKRVENQDLVLEKLLQSFNLRKMILFIGNANTGKPVHPSITSLPWNCVITTRTDMELSASFLKNEDNQPRRVIECLKKDQIRNRVFDRTKLSIIRLFGLEQRDNEDGRQDSISDLRKKRNAMLILSMLMSRIDPLTQMVVIDYPANSNELSEEEFIVSWDDCKGGVLSFFGIDETSASGALIKKAAEEHEYSWHKSSLIELLDENDEKQNVQLDGIDISADSVFFNDNVPVSIANSIIKKYDDIAQLITEQKLHEFVPQGELAKREAFINFLKDSNSKGPQWYGYLPESDFHLIRPFENTITSLVLYVLSGKEAQHSGYNTPIVLEGAPGSSKSITLAAMAYRVYNAHKNPVIFINDHTGAFSRRKQNIDEIDQYLQEVEAVCEKGTAVLVIWDGSAYRDIDIQAKKIANKLANRGRRFLLVCSAYTGMYRKNESENSADLKKRGDIEYFRIEGWHIRRCNIQESNFMYRGGCFFVESSRYLNDSGDGTNEQEILTKLIRKYTGLENSKINKIWTDLGDESRDIFSVLYKLIRILRPKLEAELFREQYFVSSYVQRQLDKQQGIQRDYYMLNPMIEAMKEAELTEEIQSILEEQIRIQEEKTDYSLNRFNDCVALFGQFKIPVSPIVAINVMDDTDHYNDVYSSSTYQLMNEIIYGVPWINYEETREGDFSFIYRSTLEASLYVEKQMNVDSQLNTITRIMDCYIKAFEESDGVSDTSKADLQNFLRMIGPNSHFPEYQTKRRKEHEQILQHLDLVIQKLTEIRNCINSENEDYDMDGSFASIEVTFTREFYGNLWDSLHNCESPNDENSGYSISDFEDRLIKLNNAIELALQIRKKSFNIIDNHMYDYDEAIIRRAKGQINSMAVELTYCNMQMETILPKYYRKCEEKNLEIDEKWRNYKVMSYSIQFRRLSAAIDTDPLNEYAYNALFRLFKKEYENSVDDNYKEEILTEISPIVMDAKSDDIPRRGLNGTELDNNIAYVESLFDKQKVNISNVLNNCCGEHFGKLFEEKLEDGNSSAILFVCQQELRRCEQLAEDKYSKYEVKQLSQEQLNICEQIVDFMMMDKYYDCVYNDSRSLHLLLKVAWMYYNECELNTLIECQRTKIKAEYWESLFNISNRYYEVTGENSRPIDILVLALSYIHYKNDYVRASQIINDLNEDIFSYYSATPRMRVPYLICDEDGNPKRFSGIVKSIRRYDGYISIHQFPVENTKKGGIHFQMRNIGRDVIPEVDEELNDLFLAIGYRGLAAYNEEGLNRKGIKW